jgi:hypothetical protein
MSLSPSSVKCSSTRESISLGFPMLVT